MNILKMVVLIVSLAVFVLSALVVREDRNNENPWATVLLCLSMAALTTLF